MTSSSPSSSSSSPSPLVLRLQQNEPTLTELHVWSPRPALREDCIYPATQEEWKEIAQAIAINTKIRSVVLRDVRAERMGQELGAVDDDDEGAGDSAGDIGGIGRTRGRESISKENMTEFCQGLSRNRSMKKMTFMNCNFYGGEMFQVMEPFLKENENLTDLNLIRCNLGDDVGVSIDLLSSALAGRTAPLNCIKLFHMAIGGTGNFVHHTNGNDYHFERDYQGCRALANLLQITSTLLKELWLMDNNINDDGAIILARALHGNTTLQKLFLDSNPNITERGCDAFCKLICDTSSIASTYESNHSLCMIDHHFCTDSNLPVSSDLKQCLKMNRKSDKRWIARSKVFRHHLNCESGEFDVKGLMGMGVKLLPHVLAWIGEPLVDECRENGNGVYGTRETFSSVFYLVQNMPR